MSESLFEIGVSPFVDGLYEEWRLQNERLLMGVCRDWRLGRRVLLGFWQGLRYDFRVGQVVGS